MNDFYRDSIANKLFGFIFSRSDEPIVIGVSGMRMADQDHRIVSEPIASGSFLESGPEHQWVIIHVCCLTHLGREKMTILRTAFSNAYS